MARQRQATSHTSVFESGSLWQRLRDTSAQALKDGALQPIETQTTYCEDRGIRFLIRVVSSLRNKPPGNNDYNPFLPFEKALHVADVSDSHVCILNKYNVVDLHLLIITRAFEHQETVLTRRDFHALWRCLREFDSLGFYNSGTRSGASQIHKHLQIVPFPLVNDPDAAGATLRSLLDNTDSPIGEITHIDELPFRHAFVRRDAEGVDDLDRLAASSLLDYLQMMQRVGIEVRDEQGGLIAHPYNLLVTRRWMLLVPRVRECFNEISLNSLAFLGALLVQNRTQLEQLRQAGPFTALKAVAFADDV